LAFWSWRFTFHCTRTCVLIHAVLRLAGICIFVTSHAWGALTKSNFPSNLAHTNFVVDSPAIKK
jgi:hypothetical protein